MATIVNEGRRRDNTHTNTFTDIRRQYLYRIIKYCMVKYRLSTWNEGFPSPSIISAITYNRRIIIKGNFTSFVMPPTLPVS